MAITQLSAFLENRPGMLCDALSAITGAGVNIRALSVADTKDFGILRIIVSDPEKTKEVLGDDIIVKETKVVAVRMDDLADLVAGCFSRNARTNAASAASVSAFAFWPVSPSHSAR